jgi:hypothetical protein
MIILTADNTKDPESQGLLDGPCPEWTFHRAVRGKVPKFIANADIFATAEGDAYLITSDAWHREEKIRIDLHPDEAREILMLDNFPTNLLPEHLRAMLP